MANNYDNSLFIAAHPDLAEAVSRKHGGLDWIKKYTHEKGGKVVEQWERNKDGVLVNVTERERLRNELARIRDEIERLGVTREEANNE